MRRHTSSWNGGGADRPAPGLIGDIAIVTWPLLPILFSGGVEERGGDPACPQANGLRMVCTRQRRKMTPGLADGEVW
jgi:hypothetical protein